MVVFGGGWQFVRFFLRNSTFSEQGVTETCASLRVLSSAILDPEC